MATKAPYYKLFNYLTENGFEERVLRGRAIEARIAALQTELKELKAEVGAMLTVTGADSVDCEGAPVTVYESKRTTYARDRLLTAGVSPEVLEACGKVTKSTVVKLGKVRGQE